MLGTDELSVQATSDSAVRSSTPHKADGSKTLPVRMVIDSLGKVIPVLNPNSNKIADLDEALLKGAVRHPDSALIGEEGNIFILGHSSYLPQVRNKNFQAFNGIQELKWGDTIKLQSESKEYIPCGSYLRGKSFSSSGTNKYWYTQTHSRDLQQLRLKGRPFYSRSLTSR